MTFFATTTTRGALSVEWYPHVSRVSLEIRPDRGGASSAVQMSVEEAKEMYDKLGAAIARAESTDPCADCDGQGLFRIVEGAELTRCETCAGEGAVPR